MSSLVIVAIPADDDIVWKVSSEKVPHLTLLYLGEYSDDDNDLAEDVQRMADFVDHALKFDPHGPFYLPVDYRGELGPGVVDNDDPVNADTGETGTNVVDDESDDMADDTEKADVLFFEGGWDSRWIKSLRSNLLQQNEIREAFENAEQFPDWVPHLTLGYPSTPAKPIPDDRKIYSVEFDRIAIWTGNYEGPEFRLKWPDEYADGPLATSHGEAAVAEVLSHHGTKGMKWGVRKEATANGGHIVINKNNRARLSTKHTTGLVGIALTMPVLTPALFLSSRFRSEVKAARAHNKAAIADEKWKKSLTSVKLGVKVHNKAADEVNRKIEGFNNDKRWNDASGKPIDLNKNSEKMSEYNRAFEKEVMNPAYAKAAIEVHGSSPHGRYQFEIKDASTATLKLRDLHKEATDAQVTHAADDSIDTGNVEFDLDIVRDPSGHILGLKWPPDAFPKEDTMAQADLGKQFVLTHASVLDNSDVAKQIKAKIQDILDDVDGDTDGDVALFGDPLIRAKLQSVLEDFYKDPNVDNAVAYGALGEVFLQHYGVLGMRWGRRRASADLSVGGKVSRLRKEGDALHNQAKTAHPSKAGALRAKGDEKHKQANALEKKAKDYLKGPDAVAPKATSIVPHGEKRKTKIEADGGQNHPAHEDALKVARAHEKLKKSGPSALSNQELRDVANRVLLENQVSLLTSHKGKKYVETQLANEGKNLGRAATRLGVRSAAKKAGLVGLASVL